MTFDPSSPNQLILIGPIGSGKTTVGQLLAERLDCSFFSLDAIERTYTESAGFDPNHANYLLSTEGLLAYYAYRRSFFDEAVVRFLADHPRGVLELGGGHPMVPDGHKQTRIISALRPYDHVILLLPTPDLGRSVEKLRAARGLKDDEIDLNELYCRDDTFYRLARHVVYTEGQAPADTCQAILERVGGA